MKKIFFRAVTATFALSAMLFPCKGNGQDVGANCNNNTPGFGTSLGTVSFKTSQTWEVGDQEWSDVVTATNCQKETFDGGNYAASNFNADCRNNEGYGDLFSWCSITRFQDDLCPGDWRVPTLQDFVDLHKALGGDGFFSYDGFFPGAGAIFTKYLSTWGGTYGGYCTADGSRYRQNWSAHYWSQTEFNEGYAYRLLFSNGEIYSQHWIGKTFGLPVRCVR